MVLARVPRVVEEAPSGHRRKRVLQQIEKLIGRGMNKEASWCAVTLRRALVRLPAEAAARRLRAVLRGVPGGDRGGERLGFTDVWLSEHHFVDDGYLPSPLVVAAAIAARTTSMGIGTNVLLLPMHHPLRVAEDAAVVDLVSGGRFTLGVGQGYVQHEFEALGFNRKNRPSLFEEGVEVVRRAWERGASGTRGSGGGSRTFRSRRARRGSSRSSSAPSRSPR